MATRAADAMKAIAAAPSKNRVRVPAIEDMDDETFISHLEKRHPDLLELKFPRPADGSPRTLPTRLAFEALHSVSHRMKSSDGYEFDHEHKEPIPHVHPTDY